MRRIDLTEDGILVNNGNNVDRIISSIDRTFIEFGEEFQRLNSLSYKSTGYCDRCGIPIIPNEYNTLCDKCNEQLDFDHLYTYLFDEYEELNGENFYHYTNKDYVKDVKTKRRIRRRIGL